MKAKSKKFQTPPITATIREAFRAWMGGVGRGELGKKLDLSVGELGRAFRALNPDKKWSELKKLHDQKSKAKPARKEGRTQQRRAA